MQRLTLATFLLSVATAGAFTSSNPGTAVRPVSTSLNVAGVGDDNKRAATGGNDNNAYMQQGSKPLAGIVDGEALAAAATAALIGAAVAGPISELDPALTALDQPLLTAALVGGATLAATSATADEDTTKVVKKVMAKPTQIVGRTLLQKFQSMLSSAKTAILDVPNKFQAFLKQKTDQTIASIQNSIERTKQSILDAPENFVKFLKLKKDETVTEIQAMPEKMQIAATDAIESTVEEMKIAPKRHGNNFMNYFRKLNGEPTRELELPESYKAMKAKSQPAPLAPTPPKTEPPKSKFRKFLRF